MSETKEKKVIDLGSGSIISTILGIFESLLFIAAGILAICYSGNADFQKTIIMIVGIILIVSGSVKVLLNFLPILSLDPAERASIRYTMVVGGSFELALGISLVVLSAQSIDAFNSIVLFLANFIGILLIVIGASLIAFAIGFLIRKLYPVYLPVSQIVLAVVAIVLGSLVLAFMNQASNFMTVVLIIVGVLLVIIGILVMVRAITLARARVLVKKQMKEQAEQEKKEAKETSTEIVATDVVEATATEVEHPSVEGPAAIDEKKEE